MLLSTSTKTEQNYDAEPTVIKKIASRGQYIVPKSDFITPRFTISSVEFTFSASKTGAVNPDLVKGSKITIGGHLSKTVDFDEKNRK